MSETNSSSPSYAQADIAHAKHVLKLQIEGLEGLISWLDSEDSFTRALELIANVKGRVIISGMGKSGHIGSKIAATLASTGTPAFFVHPGEASHGDLGMVTDDDVVILLSNSGETSELKDFINYTRRFSIPLIAMVRRKTSILVNAADIALVLPEVPEASVVKAPTTSTTMMLALGDALSVALLERKGFSAEDFGVYHPGGKLGAAFTKVADLMHQGDAMPLVKSDTLMSDALIEMTAKHFGCVAVVSDSKELQGIITDGDLRRHMSSELMAMSAKEVMTQGPVVIHPNALASEALAILQQRAITTLFVVNDNQVVGILHIHDLLRAGVA